MPNTNNHLDPELLSAYLDDEVSAAERALVEAHLSTCESCRLELESLEWTANLLRRLPVVKPPRTFYVTEGMVTPEPRPSLWERLAQQWRPLLGSASLVAALLLMLVLVQPPGRDAGIALEPADDMPIALRATERAELEVAEEAAEREEPAGIMEVAPPEQEALMVEEEEVTEEIGAAAADEEAETVTAEEEPVEEMAPELGIAAEEEVPAPVEAEAEEMLEAAEVEDVLPEAEPITPRGTPADVEEAADVEDLAVPAEEPVEEEPVEEEAAEEVAAELAEQPEEAEAEEAAPAEEPAAPEEAPIAEGVSRPLLWTMVAILLLLGAGLLLWRPTQ